MATSKMKIAFKATLAIAVLAVLVVALSLSWFYFYSRDLLGFAELGNFAPESAATLADKCYTSTIRVIPYDSFGKDLRNAILAAEGDSTEVLALRISRGFLCGSRTKELERNLLEYKASVQLRRRFTFEQLLAIYLNRAYFGHDLVGVENASLHYYGKHASELDIPEAALVAGLMKAPEMYSPERHPDRAKMRRDEVVAAMLRRGTVTSEQAKAAMRAAVR
jgi:penicillin-binding protein 1A